MNDDKNKPENIEIPSRGRPRKRGSNEYVSLEDEMGQLSYNAHTELVDKSSVPINNIVDEKVQPPIINTQIYNEPVNNTSKLDVKVCDQNYFVNDQPVDNMAHRIDTYSNRYSETVNNYQTNLQLNQNYHRATYNKPNYYPNINSLYRTSYNYQSYSNQNNVNKHSNSNHIRNSNYYLNVLNDTNNQYQMDNSYNKNHRDIRYNINFTTELNSENHDRQIDNPELLYSSRPYSNTQYSQNLSSDFQKHSLEVNNRTNIDATDKNDKNLALLQEPTGIDFQGIDDVYIDEFMGELGTTKPTIINNKTENKIIGIDTSSPAYKSSKVYIESTSSAKPQKDDLASKQNMAEHNFVEKNLEQEIVDMINGKLPVPNVNYNRIPQRGNVNYYQQNFQIQNPETYRNHNLPEHQAIYNTHSSQEIDLNNRQYINMQPEYNHSRMYNNILNNDNVNSMYQNNVQNGNTATSMNHNIMQNGSTANSMHPPHVYFNEQLESSDSIWSNSDVRHQAWMNRKRRKNNPLLWKYIQLNQEKHPDLLHPSQYSSLNFIQSGGRPVKMYIGSIKRTPTYAERSNSNNTILSLYLNSSQDYEGSMRNNEFLKVANLFLEKTMEIDSDNITVQQLKKIMREFGLNHTGKKHELLNRIRTTIQKIKDRENLFRNKNPELPKEEKKIIKNEASGNEKMTDYDMLFF
ncbi:hypothetical protein TCON_1597 [Astathelohania contejeani]|uniref:SAP domain-containing protein n=1 Tax=Astathelohania contejeani TaxID=164912 RepID=A0ABQ7HYK4_9MICR|nr:hypothetical protein TCON_1597 [Thelohania contejeani]